MRVQSQIIRRLWAGVLLLNLLMAGMMGLALRQSLIASQEKAKVTLENYSLILGGNLAALLNTVDLALLQATEEASGQIARGGIDGPQFEAYLVKHVDLLPEMAALRVANAHGDIEYSAGTVPTAKINIADRDYFTTLRDNPQVSQVISKVVFGRILNTWEIIFARRLTGAHGSFAGVIFATITMEYIQKNILAAVNIGKRGLITLWDSDFTIVVRYPDTGDFGASIGQKAMMPEFLALQRSGKEAGMFQGVNLRDNIVRVYSFRKIPKYPFSITVGMGPEDYLEDWRNEAMVLAILGGLFIMTTLFSAWAIQRSWKRQEIATGIMIQSEKMASVGGLAAGAAHEINNPLGAILQSAQMIQRHFEPGRVTNIDAAQKCGCSFEDIRRYVENRGTITFLNNIREAGTRAAAIVSSLLEFSRKSESLPAGENIIAILDKSIELAASDYDLKKKYDFRHIEIIRDYAAGLPPVPCIRTEIEQVILNLLKNAAQAMASHPSGEKKPVIILRAHLEGDTVKIEVEDNGPGMDEVVRKRVFEPFFTTKPLGAGTGLGLSVSFFIITRNHRGTIWVESVPGRGTVFTINLPLRSAGSVSG